MHLTTALPQNFLKFTFFDLLTFRIRNVAGANSVSPDLKGKAPPCPTPKPRTRPRPPQRCGTPGSCTAPDHCGHELKTVPEDKALTRGGGRHSPTRSMEVTGHNGERTPPATLGRNVRMPSADIYRTGRTRAQRRSGGSRAGRIRRRAAEVGPVGSGEGQRKQS